MQIKEQHNNDDVSSLGSGGLKGVLNKDNLKINSKLFKTEVLAGFTSAIVTMPVAIAYGYASGLGPISGFISAIVLGVIAAIIGGTQGQISSPTGALTVAISVIVGVEIGIQGSLEAAIPILVLMFFLAGLIQFLFGIMKLGENIQYIPFSVISGFMSGVGVIIIAIQIPDTFGVQAGVHTSIISKILNVSYFVKNANWNSFLITALTLLIIYGFPILTKKIPSSLVALIVLTGSCYYVDFNVDKLGPLNYDLANISFISSDQLTNSATVSRILIAAISLAFIGSVNTLLTSAVADKMTNSVHNSNQELMGQGAGNMVAAVFGGLTGSGATACAVANIQAGGRYRISGISTALFLVIFLIWGGGFMAQIPLAVISGIMISIGLILLDKVTIKKLNIIPKVDAIVMLLVMLLTAFYDLLFSVSMGLIISAIYFMKKMADQVEVETNQSRLELMIYELIETFDDPDAFKKKVLIKTIKGPLFFGFSSRFLTTMRNIPKDVKVVVFNMSLVPYMDYSGIRTFKDSIIYLRSKKVKVCFCELSIKNSDLLMQLDIIPDLIAKKYIFSSIESCVMWLDEPGVIEGKSMDPSQLYFPRAFTPNDDGIKDEWEIKNIDQYPSCHIQIFDVRGLIVFDSVGYKTPWDGICQGKPLQKGAYNFICQLDNKESENINGSVYLIR
ncbi:MAG: gliding motility-associated C-terminal domain-containing protein [Flammeovirgaceae bacterium]|jgi:sulfate permease, SulP family|nr:gliding motility-associated C-terminal domain-containing protein [Flammeovirgaceae bacterium]|tara:strand:+ start:14095 stop:16116 length:2022 start_codon:yes stop_codon:yes gene_type:complete